MSKGTTSYRIKDENTLYYLTFSTVEWLDVFTRKSYKDVIVDSLAYCRKEKGLELYSWCLMSNHIHLVAKAKEGFKMSGILRDFKKYTSKIILKKIQEEPESRRSWLLPIMRESAIKNSKIQAYQLWRNDNHPIVLYTTEVIEQKMKWYIHQNPVEAGIVVNAEDYLYSSARSYAELDNLLEIDKF